ncbi:MAG: hypothetical protein AB7G23_21465 [Vicinamibacterales bacterium]
MTPLLPRPVTLLCAALAVAGVVFAAVTEGLIVSAVRTALAFLSILLGTVFLVSVASVFDWRGLPSKVTLPATDQVTHASPAPTPVQPAGGSMHALLEQLYPEEPEPAVPAPLRLVDADTGELVGDRVLRLEERMTELTKEVVDLGTVVQDQAELTAKAFGTLRREVERIAHVFPEAADAV